MRTIFFALILIAPVTAQAQSCPEPLGAAQRLVLAVAPSMNSNIATVRRFQRASPQSPWKPLGGPQSALIGHKGVAWAYAFRQFAENGEPVKVDGDKRSPAGFFRLGKRFGFSPARWPDYLHIVPGTVCVDDPASPAYNTVTNRAEVGWHVHGENMWQVKAYRRGIMVDYPTNREARAGSCIFIHLRLPDATGTSGCLALPEPQLKTLQNFAQGGAVLAVLPRQALGRFKGCLPP